MKVGTRPASASGMTFIILRGKDHCLACLLAAFREGNPQYFPTSRALVQSVTALCSQLHSRATSGSRGRCHFLGLGLVPPALLPPGEMPAVGQVGFTYGQGLQGALLGSSSYCQPVRNAAAREERH